MNVNKINFGKSYVYMFLVTHVYSKKMVIQESRNNKVAGMSQFWFRQNNENVTEASRMLQMWIILKTKKKR